MPRADSPVSDPRPSSAPPPAILADEPPPRPRRKGKDKLPAPDNGTTYIWEDAVPGEIPLAAREAKQPPQQPEPQPSKPQARLSHPTPWSRIWRIFLAGAIMGVATVKAAELLLHPDPRREKA